MSFSNDVVFAVRIVTCEHYTAPPIRNLDIETSSYRGSAVRQAPVIRIFGSTPAGQKCCLHVHGVFPYFYVPSPVASPTQEFLKQFAAAIDTALNSSFENSEKNTNNEKRQHVYGICPVYKIPFYGYHVEETLFLKILFYNPSMLKRAGDFLQSGAIMNTVFQPHELHVPFELKFMIDHDLYGMDYIMLRNVKFRVSGASEVAANHSGSPTNLPEKIWNVNSLEDRYRLPAEIKRISTCELEADCLAQDIIRPVRDEESGDRPDLPTLPDEAAQFELLRNILAAAEDRLDESDTLGEGDAKAGEANRTADDSLRNLSLGSDYSIVHTFAELMAEGITENAGCPAAVIDPVREEESEDDEDPVREAMEMSQRIEDASDSDHEADGENCRLPQLDGPLGDIDESIPVIDLSSDSSVQDSSSEDDSPLPDQLDVVPESPQSSTSRGSAQLDEGDHPAKRDEITADTADTGFTRLRSPATRPITEMDMVSVLCPAMKLPSRKEMSDWLADPGNIEDTKSDFTQRGDDLDAVDLEEIQCRLSPDESVVMGGSADKSVDAELNSPAWETPVRAPSTISSRRRSSRDTPITSSQRRPATKRSRISWSQPLAVDESFASEADQFQSLLGSLSHVLMETGDETAMEECGGGFALRRRERMGLMGEAYKANTKASSPKSNKVKKNVSELDAPLVADSFGFNSSEVNLAGANITPGAPNLTVLSLETHVNTRLDLRPDPEYDSIGAIFYAVSDDRKCGQRFVKGALVVCANDDEKRQSNHLKAFDDFRCDSVDSESDLLNALVSVVRKYDPDVLIGYEIQLLSWGFVFERAQSLGIDLCAAVSRVPDSPKQSRFSTRDDWWSMADCHIAGRIVLNLGRLIRHEVNLYQYSFENVVYNLLRKRVPSYDFRTLSRWFLCLKTRWRVFDYYFLWVISELEMLANCDLLNRTSELARLFGCQFFEVLSRGSQFRVESMLLRMSKDRNYVAFSPSVQQRNRMAAPECIALTMEPESDYYTEPVLVLDFQSLYPSMVIAHNYCFSTCLGKIRNYANGEVIEFGCHKLAVPHRLLHSLLNDMTISPAGVAFVRRHVRRGVMAQMLEEILDTRVMVKQSAKLYKNDKSLKKILDARQLGLKMIANVTYGYAAATYSGRMPCVEVADSIVEKGRETLIRAIDMVRNEKKWDARVVYGDTDSLFVVLRGRTKEDAFRIGHEIVDAVTADNPKPIKLKLEKVYQPCVLQTKKRYVGYAYESADQKEPTFDAKGIETVRRDSCPAVAKILQKALETLFVSNDQSTVRDYVVRQFQRIHMGRVSPLDFILTRKYNGREAYKTDAVAPALVIAKRRLQKDRRGEPRIKERVPYVIAAGHPGATLISCVREPTELAFQRGLRLYYKYYITKQICPALNRVFKIMGTDTLAWYRGMPRVDRALYGFGLRGEDNRDRPGNVITLSQYFQVKECVVCRTVTTRENLCSKCASDPQNCAVELENRIRCLERRRDNLYRMCNLCMHWRPGTTCGSVECVSMVCPITFKRTELDYDLKGACQLRRVLKEL